MLVKLGIIPPGIRDDNSKTIWVATTQLSVLWPGSDLQNLPPSHLEPPVWPSGTCGRLPAGTVLERFVLKGCEPNKTYQLPSVYPEKNVGEFIWDLKGNIWLLIEDWFHPWCPAVTNISMPSCDRRLLSKLERICYPHVTLWKHLQSGQSLHISNIYKLL